MILLKILSLICIFLFVCSVNSFDVTKTRTYKQIDRLARQKYNYNHPPFDENEADPVTKVKEERDNQEGKVLETNVSTNEERTTAREEIPIVEEEIPIVKEETPIVEEEIPIVEEETPIFEEETKTESTDVREEPEIITKETIIEKSYNQNRLLKLSAQFVTEREQKIPVSVIYEAKPDVKSRTKIENSLRARGRSRDLRKKLPSRQSDSIEASRKPVQGQTDISQRTEEVIRKETSPPHNTAKTTDTTTIRKRTRERDPVVRIINSENLVYTQNGQFRYSYEGGDGTKAYSKGELRTVGEEKGGEAVSGGFSYKDKEGNDFSLTYTADENGYRPVGAHLPTPPPIPPEIARALAYLATKTTPEPVTEAYSRKNKKL